MVNPDPQGGGCPVTARTRALPNRVGNKRPTKLRKTESVRLRPHTPRNNPQRVECAWAPPLHTHPPALTAACVAVPCQSPRQRRRMAPPSSVRCAVASAQPSLYSEAPDRNGLKSLRGIPPKASSSVRPRPDAHARGHRSSTRDPPAFKHKTRSWGEAATPRDPTATTLSYRGGSETKSPRCKAAPPYKKKQGNSNAEAPPQIPNCDTASPRLATKSGRLRKQRSGNRWG